MEVRGMRIHDCNRPDDISAQSFIGGHYGRRPAKLPWRRKIDNQGVNVRIEGGILSTCNCMK